MAFGELMGLTNRLLVNAQALAAVAARMRLDELGTKGDPAVRAQIDRVVEALDAGDQLDALDERERSMLLSFARSYLTQALDLVENPERPGAWTQDNPVLLQAQGSASGAVARLLAGVGLGGEDARILDVGTGVAGLAIAFCTSFPAATVVGIDPFEPALSLARENVAGAGLESRITLRPTPIQELEDAEGFDLVWLPSFFIPEAVLDDALERAFAVTRPEGVLVVGVLYAGGDDPLAAAADDLFTVRSGGSLLYPEAAIERLERVGFTDVHELERTWDAPLRFVVGLRP